MTRKSSQGIGAVLRPRHLRAGRDSRVERDRQVERDRLAHGGGMVVLPFPLGARTGWVYPVLALLLPLYFYLIGIDAFPLRDNNEGLYAEIAREMLETGNYVVPHLNGVPYIEKPPLLYWMMSLSMSLFGVSAAAARLVSALAMLALCAGLFQFCRAHGRQRAGCFAAIGMASAFPATLLAHAALFDPLLTALLGGALLCFLHGYLVDQQGPVRWAALLLALAVLEKGLVALVLAFGTVGLFLLAMRRRQLHRRRWDPVALALFIAVAAPWHCLAATRQAEFSWFYFINEHVLRFLGMREPDDYHRGPIWFYLPRLLLMLVPWTPFLCLLRTSALRDEDGPDATIVRFCQAGTLFPLLFFSLSQAKADYYLLVAMPMAALWLALEIAPRLTGHPATPPVAALARCWGMSAACLGLLVGVLVAMLVGALRVRTPLAFQPESILLLALAWSALSLLATRAFVRLSSARAREMALLGTALLAIPAMALLMRQIVERGERNSSRDVVQVIEGAAPRAVFIYRDYEDVFSSMPFYLGRRVPVIDSVSRDLEFGCRLQPERACIGVDTFFERAARGPVAVAVRADREPAFRAMAGWRAWDVVTLGDKLVFLSKPP